MSFFLPVDGTEFDNLLVKALISDVSGSSVALSFSAIYPVQFYPPAI
jgi:hypothetical protein